MSKFDLKFQKNDNSHPREKIALREWVLKYISSAHILDVYGGNGLMFEKVWKLKSANYQTADGDALQWLQAQNKLTENCFDVDPYASPYEALEIIGKKTTAARIGIVCTDGTLRRVAMMRTHIPAFLRDRCGWPERSLTLMAGIYHQYPRYLRHVLACILPQWEIERLTIQYGKGTWKQATVYFAAVLTKRPIAQTEAIES
jgi:hypothetical protein